MNKLLINIKSFCYLMFFFFALSHNSLLLAQAELINENNNSQKRLTLTEFLKRIEIGQGKGTFVQNKHFKFLSQPIVSEGQFILSEQAALWETQSPIFSQLLLTPKIIYTRLNSSKTYQPLVENAAFSQLLSTLLSGQFEDHDWQQISMTDSNCINLTPANSALEKVFKQVQVCLVDQLTRQINLLDTNDNKTNISMLLTHKNINQSDTAQLNPKNTTLVTP